MAKWLAFTFLLVVPSVLLLLSEFENGVDLAIGPHQTGNTDSFPWSGYAKCPTLTDFEKIKNATRVQKSNTTYFSLHTQNGMKYWVKLQKNLKHSRYTHELEQQAWFEVYTTQLASVLGISNAVCAVGAKIDLTEGAFRCLPELRNTPACAAIPKDYIFLSDKGIGREYVLASVSWDVEWKMVHNFDVDVRKMMQLKAPIDNKDVQRVVDASNVRLLDFLVENRDIQWLDIRGRYVQIDEGKAFLNRFGVCAKMKIRGGTITNSGMFPVISPHEPDLCVYSEQVFSSISSQRAIDIRLRQMGQLMESDPLLAYSEAAIAGREWAPGFKSLKHDLALCVRTRLIVASGYIKRCIQRHSAREVLRSGR
jgi:hypothetical protein